MRIITHFSVVGFCNTYVKAPDGSGDCVIIDPGHVDIDLVNLLVKENLTVRWVLLTHTHPAHCQGLGTLLKIWKPTVYCADPRLLDYPAERVYDGARLQLGQFPFTAIRMAGHSSDSIAWLSPHAVFSGDTLFSCRIPSTQSMTEQNLLLSSIERNLMPLDENCLLYPGHGPVSKIRIERMFNQDLARLRTIEPALRFWREEE